MDGSYMEILEARSGGPRGEKGAEGKEKSNREGERDTQRYFKSITFGH